MALGQIGTTKAKAALLEIIEKKEPEKLKKDLPEGALSQLPGNEGVEALIKVAKTHPNRGQTSNFILARTSLNLGSADIVGENSSV